MLGFLLVLSAVSNAVYLCAVVLAKGALGLLVYIISLFLCWGSVQVFDRSWGFDVRLYVCMHVFCFCFNFCVALHLGKKRVWSKKWGEKQRFVKDL